MPYVLDRVRAGAGLGASSKTLRLGYQPGWPELGLKRRQWVAVLDGSSFKPVRIRDGCILCDDEVQE